MTKRIPPAVPLNIRKELYEDLRDPAYASAYVNEALLEGDEVVFKTAVADVVRARGVMNVAKRAGINRVTVFKTLKPETRTSFTTFHSLLTACGIDFVTRPMANKKSRNKSPRRATK